MNCALDREYAVCYCSKGVVRYLVELSFSPYNRYGFYDFRLNLCPLVFTYREACNIINLLYSLEYFPKSRKLVIEKVDVHE